MAIKEGLGQFQGKSARQTPTSSRANKQRVIMFISQLVIWVLAKGSGQIKLVLSIPINLDRTPPLLSEKLPEFIWKINLYLHHQLEVVELDDLKSVKEFFSSQIICSNYVHISSNKNILNVSSHVWVHSIKLWLTQ